jgi:steroid delta-isomerase
MRPLGKWLLHCVVAAAAVWLPAPAQAQDSDAAAIRAALVTWMDDFNAGRAEKVCDLFAPDLRAQFRGQPERDHDGVCTLLKRSMSDPATRYSYALAIKEILVLGDHAVVRLIWTLTVQIKSAPGDDASIEEPGMDLFKRQPDGRWKIIRYIAYEDPPR